MRQRVINQDDNDDVNEQESFIMNMNKRNSNNQMPTAADLLTSETKPSKTGYCEKKNNSILLYYFPFLSCLYPLWKRRYFILIGNYLFKYESQDGEKPKGVPIPLDASTVKILDDDRTSFEISLIRKTYIIKCSNVDECRSWVVALRDRKAQAIREKLGHAPITDSVKAFNKAAGSLVDNKLKKERDEIKELTDKGNGVFNPMMSGYK